MKKHNITTSFSTCKKLGQILTTVKDITPPLKQKGVYEIPCCCEKTYIGETGRSVQVRLKEHIADEKYKRTKSALAEHTLETNHGILFDKTKLIHRENHYLKRKIKETIEIVKSSNSLNKEDSYKLSKTWLPILKKPS